jgi:hypothetical protein
VAVTAGPRNVATNSPDARQQPSVARSPAANDPLDVDVEEEWREGALLGAQNGFYISGLPPNRTGLQRRPSVKSQVLIFRRVRQFIVATEYDDAHERGLCLGYIEGVVEYMEAVRINNDKPRCVPPGTDPKEVRDAVVNYLRDQPQDRSKAPIWSVNLAVITTWKYP